MRDFNPDHRPFYPDTSKGDGGEPRGGGFRGHGGGFHGHGGFGHGGGFHGGHGGGRPFFHHGPHNRHFGLAEHDAAPIVPPVPTTPPPAAFQASVFGKLDPRLQYAIADAGYAVPTPIQEKAIPFVLEGRDLIGCAQTGTGKTAAFMLPILDHLLKTGKETAAVQPASASEPSCPAQPAQPARPAQPALSSFRPGHPRALILSPTRELAAQTAQNDATYSKYTGTPFAVVFGGVSQFPQVKAIQHGAEVVIATPGRLIDLMTQGVVFLDAIEMFVLDEADRMLDMGFLPDIKRIISKLPAQRQSLFFSATLSPQIMRLAGELVHDPEQIMIAPEHPTVDRINQKVMFVERNHKDELLIHLLQTHPEWDKVIVFARTRHGADRVERKVTDAGIRIAAIHSDKSQGQRTRALDGFRHGAVRVLVATDIASRGIDVPDIALVVNMELPDETESYVHRIGRTARAGESGCAISFVAPDERCLLKAVERFIRMSIPVDRDQPFHSEAAEKATGKQGEGLPQAPWIRNRGGRRGGNNGSPFHPQGYHSPHSGSFRPYSRGGGNGGPAAPGGGNGGAPAGGYHGKPGGGYWQKRDDKKFVHPANAKRSHHNRTNYEGRTQPDFGQHPGGGASR